LDFAGPTRWRFRLTDPSGAFLADQSVELDATQWQFEAFTDPHHYLRWNAVPDRRLEHEAELLGAVGEWMAARVLGDIAPVLARQRRAVRLGLGPERSRSASRAGCSWRLGT